MNESGNIVTKSDNLTNKRQALAFIKPIMIAEHGIDKAKLFV